MRHGYYRLCAPDNTRVTYLDPSGNGVTFRRIRYVIVVSVFRRHNHHRRSKERISEVYCLKCEMKGGE